MNTPNYIEVLLCALCHKLVDYDLGNAESVVDIEDSFIQTSNITFAICNECEEVLYKKIIEKFKKE